MNRTNNTNFDIDYLVGNLRDRASPKTTLQELGISKNEIQEMCASSAPQTRAASIVNLAKKTLLREMQGPNSSLVLPLGERVAQITAHVYSRSYLSDTARQELTEALNTEIHMQSTHLTDELPDNISLQNLETHQKTLGLQIHQTESQIQDHEQKIETLKAGSSLFKDRNIQTLREKITQERNFLDAAVHTQNIFHQIIGREHPHRLRTRPTSQFHVTLEPNPENVGKGYEGLGIAFSSLQESNPMFVSCSPLSSNDPRKKCLNWLQTQTLVPVEIELGNGRTKWALIAVPLKHVPKTVTDWLNSDEGKSALEQTKNSDWTLADELNELQYRYVPTSENIEKRHMFSGRHTYISPHEVLLGREDHSPTKFDGELGHGDGGCNTIYNATTYEFTSGKLTPTQNVVRKAKDTSQDTAEEAAHKQEIYKALAGCQHVAVPKLRTYQTLQHNKTKTLETMELCNQGSLNRVTFTSPQDKLSVCTQIASGVTEMHERGVCHGDLKPGNIFLDQKPGQNLQAFVSDVDSAAFFNQVPTSHTPTFLAPEYRSDTTSSFQRDVNAPVSMQDAIARDSWALGWLLYKATQANFFFSTHFYPDARSKVRQAAQNQNASVQDKINYVIIQLLNPIPEQRMTAQQAHEALQAITA
jgi:hypothetical protein